VLRERYVHLGKGALTLYLDRSTADPATGRVGTFVFAVKNRKRPGRLKKW
jgi:hypothetical protein